MRRLPLLLILLLLVAGPAAVRAEARTPDSHTFARAVAVPAAEADGAWRTAPLEAGRGFDLLGASWRGGAAHVAVRVRRGDGTWSAWRTVHRDEPVWSDRAQAVELRGAGPVRGLRLRLVAVDRARAPTVPHASAAAAGGPAVVPRSAWDPRGECRPRATPRYGRVDFAIVHHTESLSSYGPESSAAMVLAICRFHRDGNRWLDIGYNLLVDRFGTVFEGRAGGVEAPAIGAQAGGWNAVSTGVALLGSHTAAPPTPAARRALAQVLAWKLTLAGVPAQGSVQERSYGGEENRHPGGSLVRFARIAGHRDADHTDCPGGALYRLLPSLRREVAALQPAGLGPLLTLSPLGAPLEQAAPAWLTGRLVDAAGRRPAGAAVVVEQQLGGAWVVAAQARTGADGIWNAYPQLTGNGPLRAVAPAHGLSSPELDARVRSAVRLRVAPRRVRPAGARAIAVSGATVPPKPHVRVVVERQLATGEQRTVRSIPAPTSGGAFALTVRLPRAAGLYRVSARALADAANATGYSPVRVVRVLRAR